MPSGSFKKSFRNLNSALKKDGLKERNNNNNYLIKSNIYKNA
jgi:hypothetical protein